MIILGVYRLGPDVVMPAYGTSMAACFDLCFCPTTETITGYNKHNFKFDRPVHVNDVSNDPTKYVWIDPGDRLLVPTGLVMKLRQFHSVETFADITKEHDELKQFSIRLHARSGLALKKGLVLANAEGIVDVDYQQQVYILMHNISEVKQIITEKERIAQGEIVVNELINEIVNLNDMPTQYSERNGGFGSTGTGEIK